MSPPIRITHFSDVLCVWAYIGQRRVDELREEFGGRVTIDYRMTSVFGFARDKLTERWRDKGGLSAYARHVREIVDRFPHVPLCDAAWAEVAPTSSVPAHLVLAAIRQLETEGRAPAGAFVEAASRIRHAFFRDARDVSRQEVLFEAVADPALDLDAVREGLASGAAHAELARDDHLSHELDVRVSPTLVMNEGRQRLAGNVGYRVIAANVREILDNPANQASWC